MAIGFLKKLFTNKTEQKEDLTQKHTPENLCFLADHYKDDKTFTKAFTLYKIAAEKKYPEALFKLGYCYHYGEGTSKNSEKAFDSFKESAELGLPPAQFILSSCYRDGIGTQKDAEKTLFWQKKAAENGWMPAQISLSKHYYNKKDFFDSLKWLDIAVKAKSPEAYLMYSMYYEKGLAGLEKDEKKAFEWVKRGADEGFPVLKVRLGSFYGKGIGVEQNDKEAFKLYREAAEKGDQCAIQILDLTAKEFEKCKKQAELGDAEAQWKLANDYIEGAIVPANGKLAFEWYERAAGQGNKKAIEVINKIKSNQEK